MCMRRPICDLVIGNIPGARNSPKVVVKDVIKQEEMAEEAQAVVTRAQAKKAEQPLNPLATAKPPDAKTVSVAELMKAQKENTGLAKMWELATKGTERSPWVQI